MPDVAKAPDHMQSSQDELAQMVHRLAAQRDEDQKAWQELVEVISNHALKIESIEHQDMQYNDMINLVGTYCQGLTKDTDNALRSQLDLYAAEINANLGNLEGKLNGTIQEAKMGFEKFSQDSTVLIQQIDARIIQIQSKLNEHESRLQGAPVREPFLRNGAYTAAETFNIATPAKTAVGSPVPETPVQAPPGVPQAATPAQGAAPAASQGAPHAPHDPSGRRSTSRGRSRATRSARWPHTWMKIRSC